MDQESKLRRFSCLSMNQKLKKIQQENEQCLNLFKSLYQFKYGDSQQSIEQQNKQEDHILDDRNKLSDLTVQQGKNQFLNTLLIKKAQMLNQQKSIIHEEQFSLGVSQVFQRVTLKQQTSTNQQRWKDSEINCQINLTNNNGNGNGKIKDKRLLSSSNILLNLNHVIFIQDNDNNLNHNSRNGFSLSNFNSFNNNQNNQTIQNDKKQLSHEVNNQNQNHFESFIAQIQKKLNKKLSQKGINKIIKNIQKTKNQLQKQHKINQEKVNYQVKSFSKINDSNALTERKIEINQKSLKKKQQQKSLSAAKRNLFLKIKDKQNSSIKSFCQDENKQKLNKNLKTSSIQSKDTRNLVKKSLKIIRNNRSSHLEYIDNRDIQQYCIINKIFGKNKKMILWAIQNQRPIITLDRE